MPIKNSYGYINLFSNRLIWGNAGQGAKALSAAAYQTGDRDDGLGSGVIRIDEPCDIMCHATVSGTACTSVYLVPQWSPIGENNFEDIPYERDYITSVEFGTKIHEITPAAAGDYELVFSVPGPCDFRLTAMRVGGAADSSLVCFGHAVANGGHSMLNGQGNGHLIDVTEGLIYTSRAGQTLEAALALASSGDKIIVNSDVTALTAIVSADDIAIEVRPNGSITLGANDVTINCPFDAGNYSVFVYGGAGVVIFGGQVPVVNARWWGLDPGASVATNDNAIQYALDTLKSVYLPGNDDGVYQVGGPLEFYAGQHIFGDGWNYRQTVVGVRNTVLEATTANHVFEPAGTGVASGCRFSDFTIDANDIATGGIFIERGQFCIVERVFVDDIPDDTWSDVQTWGTFGVFIRGRTVGGAYYNVIRNCVFEGEGTTKNYNRGIIISSETSATTPTKANLNKIENCVITKVYAGIDFDNGNDDKCEYCQLSENYIGIRNRSDKTKFTKPYIENVQYGIYNDFFPDTPGTSIVNATYRWTLNAGSEYYLELAAGGDPGIAEPDVVCEHGNPLKKVGHLNIGSLAEGEWAYGDPGSGFDTINVRIYNKDGEGADPDLHFEDYLAYDPTYQYTRWPQINGVGSASGLVIPVGGNWSCIQANTTAPIGTGDEFLRNGFRGIEKIKCFVDRTQLDFSDVTGDFVIRDTDLSSDEDVLRYDASRNTLVLGGTEAEVNTIRVVKGVYDFTVDGGAHSTNYILGELPNNAYIIRAWYEQLQAFTSGGAATVRFGISAQDNQALLNATAYNNAIFNVGVHDFKQDGTAANFSVKTTNRRDVIMYIGGGANLTAGKVRVWVEYIISPA